MRVTPGQVMVEFADPDAVLRALDLLRQHGYRDLETFSPYPIDGTAERLGLPRSALPAWVFAGGVVGAVLGYGIQWYADTYDYPLNVGARPMHSAVAFIPATFEAAILGAAVAAFVVLLVAIGLPALWHPAFEMPRFARVTSDRYWVCIRGMHDAPEARSIRRLLAELTPLRVSLMEDEP